MRTNISYERRFTSYVLALLKNSYEKRARITLMKLTIGFIRYIYDRILLVTCGLITILSQLKHKIDKVLLVLLKYKNGFQVQ